VANPIFTGDKELKVEILKILLRATLVSKDHPGQKCYKLAGTHVGILIPVVRADSTLIIGSGADESPDQFPHGLGLRGVMAKRVKKMKPNKLTVQEVVHQLGFKTNPLSSATKSINSTSAKEDRLERAHQSSYS